VAVVLNNARDVSSVPMQIQYDSSKLTLVGVAKGDLLDQGGQDAPILHSEAETPGSPMHTVSIVSSRPPGTPGANGSGTVFTLTFRAKQSGESDLIVTQHQALDSAQHPVLVSAHNAHIVVP
jgi:general secretion pathway protein D